MANPAAVWVGQVVFDQALAFAKALLRNRPWQKRLASQVRRRSQLKISRRRLRKWLEESETAQRLFQGELAPMNDLTESLISHVWPDSREDRSQEARLVIEHALGNLLIELPPPLATAVADNRTAIRFQELHKKLDALGTSPQAIEFRDLIRRAPPGVGPLVQRAYGVDPADALTFLRQLVEGEPPRVAIRRILAESDFLERTISNDLMLAAAEAASSYEEHELAAEAFEKSATLGGELPGRLWARAASEANSAGDRQAADDFLRRAKENAPLDPFVEFVSAVLEGETTKIVQLADRAIAATPDQVRLISAVRANALLLEKKWDEALDAAERLRQSAPEYSGPALVAARALLARAQSGRSESRDLDLDRALQFAIQARDLRRRWRGDSSEAVVVACQAAILRHAWDDVLRLGTPTPSGDASEVEAAASSVAAAVVAAAVVQDRSEEARAARDRIQDPFELHHATALLLEHESRPNEEVRDQYLEALKHAGSLEQKLAVWHGLAFLGEWPLPGVEDLQQEHGEQLELLAAESEAARGNHAAAIARLRPLAAESRLAAAYLPHVYLEADQGEAAVSALRQAHERFHDAEFLISAAQALRRMGRRDEAIAETQRALSVAADGSEARRSARGLLIELLSEEGKWNEVEEHARALLSKERFRKEARWALVFALFFQGKSKEAWSSASREPPLTPETAQQARLILSLLTSQGSSAGDVSQALEIGSRYAESEEVAGAALWAVLAMNQREGSPPASEKQKQEFQGALEEFVQRFPDSKFLWRVETSTDEDLLQRLQEVTQPGSATFRELQLKASLGQAPVGILSAFVRRPYAEAWFRRAAGCLPVHPELAEAQALEVEAAKAALDAEVVIESSSLVLLSNNQGWWPRILPIFRAGMMPLPSFMDIVQTRDSLALRGTTSVGWDPDQDRLNVSELSDDVAEDLAKRSQWVVDAASKLRHVDWQELRHFPDLDHDRYAPWLAPLDLAREQARPLYSDDLALRALARSVGVQAFGLVAISSVLEERGDVTAAERQSLLAALVKDYAVDFPVSQAELEALGNHTNWTAGVSSYQLTRPAFWRNWRQALETYAYIAGRVSTQAADQLGTWLYAAIWGLARATDQKGDAAVALVTQTAVSSPMTPPSFAQILTAARSACKALGIEDPLHGTLIQLRQLLMQTAGPQHGIRYLLHLVSGLSREDQLESARILLSES